MKENKMRTTDKKLTLIALAWPIFMETFLRMLLGNVNIFMLSQYSDEAVGAVGVANQLMNMIIMIYGVISTGTAVIISQNLGAGNRAEASRTANVALIVNLVFGLAMSAGVAIGARGILKMMNLQDELMGYALPYLVIVGLGSFTQALIATMSAIARNYGQTKIAMMVAIGMNVINVIGNCIVVFRPFGIPDFGVTGIAVSLVVSEIIATIFMFHILYKGLDIGLHFSIPKPFPFDIFKDIVKIGIPAGGEFISYQTAQLVSTYIVTTLGTEALATRIYTQNLILFAAMTGISIGQATQILVGHLVGAGEEEEAYKACYKSLRISMLCNTALAVVFFILRKPLLGIFTQDPAIIALGSQILLLDIVLEPGRVFNQVVANALRGAGDVRWPVVAGIFSMWGVSVALGYILGVCFQMGFVGVYMGCVADEWLRGQIMNWRWRSGIWKNMRVVKVSPKQEAQYAR